MMMYISQAKPDMHHLQIWLAAAGSAGLCFAALLPAEQKTGAE